MNEYTITIDDKTYCITNDNSNQNSALMHALCRRNDEGPVLITNSPITKWTSYLDEDMSIQPTSTPVTVAKWSSYIDDVE